MKPYHNLHLIPPPLLAKVLIGLGIFLTFAPLIPSNYGISWATDYQPSGDDYQAENGRR